MRAHYHVYGAVPGCLPDSHDVCETIKEARAALKEAVETDRELGRDMRGSLKAGAFTDADPFGAWNAWIEKCTDRACIECPFDAFSGGSYRQSTDATNYYTD